MQCKNQAKPMHVQLGGTRERIGIMVRQRMMNALIIIEPYQYIFEGHN